MTYQLHITTQTNLRDLEFVAYQYPLKAAGELPMAPGAVRWHDAEPVLLHIAPGRWLAPAANDETRSQLQSLAEAGACHEVEGKWVRFELRGTAATALLSETLDVVAVLAGRDSAAVTLFDCPSILLRRQDGFTVWTRASHRVHLQAEFDRLTGR